MKKTIVILLSILALCVFSACGTNKTDATNIEPRSFVVKIVNESVEEIYHIGYSLYVNDNIEMSGGTSNANGTAISKGDSRIVEIAPRDVPGIDEYAELGIQITVRDKDGNEYPCSSKLSFGAEKGAKYTIYISGNFEEGFVALRDESVEYIR